MNSDLIKQYFPNISEIQVDQFNKLYDIYLHWNNQINVISRKDVELLYERHILHSLAIAKVVSFLPHTKILDIGTGGGFPGIPLSILYPQSNFTLIDAIGKKIKVVNEVINEVKIANAKGFHLNANKVDSNFDFIVSRAVTRLNDFYPWVKNRFNKKSNHQLKNGVLYLKGGDLKDEIEESKLKNVQLFSIKEFYNEPFFETKYVVYFPAQ